MTDQWNNRLTTGVQWTLTVLAFWYVAREVSWSETLDLLADIDPLVLLVVVVITLLEFGSRFSQWWILLNGIKKTPLSTTIRIDLVIKFINHIIPSKAAGHSIAPLVVKHYTDTKLRDAATLSGLNTGLYATLYGLVSLCGLLIFFSRLSWGPAVVIFLSSVMYAVVGVLVLLAGYRLELAGVVFNRIQRFATGVPRIGSRLAGLVGKLPSFTEESAAIFSRLPSERFRSIYSRMGGDACRVPWCSCRSATDGTRWRLYASVAFACCVSDGVQCNDPAANAGRRRCCGGVGHACVSKSRR